MANKSKWKPFYQKRGTKYMDGREKICIAWHDKEGKKRMFTLPKPETLLELLNGSRETLVAVRINGEPQNHELNVPKVHK